MRRDRAAHPPLYVSDAYMMGDALLNLASQIEWDAGLKTHLKPPLLLGTDPTVPTADTSSLTTGLVDSHRADLSEILARVEGVVRPSMIVLLFCCSESKPWEDGSGMGKLGPTGVRG